MDLRVLRYLVAVVEAGSLSGAAARVHVAQPSLSRQLRSLERELGIDLFAYGAGNRLLLSPAGEQLLPLVRDLLVRADHVSSAARAIRTGRVERLVLVAPPTTIADVIAPCLASSQADDPIVDVREDTVDDAATWLGRGADLVVLSGVPNRRHAWEPIARLPLFAYVNDEHSLAREVVVSVGALVQEPLAILTRHHGTRRLLDLAVADAGVTYAEAVECESPQAAQSLAAAGRAVAVVSDDSRFGLHPLFIEGTSGILRIPLHAEWVRGHYGTATIRRLVQRLSAYCEQRYGSQVRLAREIVGEGSPG